MISCDLKDMTGKWNEYYEKNNILIGLGSPKTYEIGMKFLQDCETVEDWGCGNSISKVYCRSNYIGIDGSNCLNASVICDLRFYTSSVDGIFIRHLLDHNIDWKLILKNAIQSFNKKLCLIIGSPSIENTVLVNIIEDRKIPNIQFNKNDITSFFSNLMFEYIEVDNEQIFLIKK